QRIGRFLGDVDAAAECAVPTVEAQERVALGPARACDAADAEYGAPGLVRRLEDAPQHQGRTGHGWSNVVVEQRNRLLGELVAVTRSRCAHGELRLIVAEHRNGECAALAEKRECPARARERSRNERGRI